MKRLFLLIAVCMIGMVNALAGFTVVPNESGAGSYVLTFKETAGEGETLYDWSDISDVDGNNPGSVSYLSDATSISIVTEGDYNLTTIDVKNIIGSNYPRSKFTSAVTLDMGEAVLGENTSLLETNAGSLTSLKNFVFPQNTKEIPEGMFQGHSKIEEIIFLDPDNLEGDHLTTIPKNAFQSCANLSTVRIPNGVESIGENAFEKCPFEAISLPNTLTTIGKTAFGSCTNLKSITIPASVNNIGPSAFQKNTSMTDVYVIGNDVRIGDQAFDHNLTQNGFVYHDNNDGNVTIEDWQQSNGTLPLRLHIPNNPIALERYMNPSLQFLNALNDPVMIAKALKALDESIQDEELEELVPQTIDRISHYYSDRWFDGTSSDYPYLESTENVINKLKELCHTNQLAHNAVENDAVLPSKWETMEGWRYFHEASGRFNFSPSEPQYQGWWNFMFVAGDIDEKTWPDTRLVDSRWYSAVFPFDLSFNQVESAYGANTDVREFTNVWEHEVDNKLIRTVRFNTKPTIPSATSGGRSVDKNKAGYIKAGRPYMIHPGTRVEVITVGDKEVGRTIAGVNVDEADAIIASNGINSEGQNILETETVERSLVYDEAGNNKGEQKYYFKGTFKPQTLLANSFYLGYDPQNPTKWPLAFYVTTTDLAEKWSAFTSIVRKTNDSATDNSNAKSMGIDFTLIIPEEEIFGITTGIESVSDQKSVNNGVVYNLNGQIIGNQSTSNLSKGIYIVNGKKIVVR